MWTVVAALIAALAGYAGARLNYRSQQETNASNLEAVNATNQAQMELAGQTNQWQREEWLRQFNLENEYNLPVNQMNRYRQAGINPALAMGGNLVDATASSPAQPQGHMASLMPFQAIAPQMNFDWLQNINSDAVVKSAQADLLRAQATKTRSETEGQGLDNRLKELNVQAEEAIQNYNPYSYLDADGNEIQVAGENLRVNREWLVNELKRQDVNLNNAEMNDIAYNWYVMTGYYVNDSDSENPYQLNNPFNDPANNGDFWNKFTSTPEYQRLTGMLKGDKELQDLSIKLTKLDYEAQQAAKAGQTEFAEWVKNNKDNPLVQFMLILRGWLQTSSLPSVVGSFPRISVNKSFHDHIHYGGRK